MAELNEDIELEIDDYLDGRMEPSRRAVFEERIKRDPELRSKVLSATRSVQLVQQALGWVTPGEEFDSKVSSKIIELTQSGHRIEPARSAAVPSRSDAPAHSPIAEDPVSGNENRRLLLIAVAVAVLFALAVCAIVYSIAHSTHAAP